MATTQKAIDIARDLAAEFTTRFGALATPLTVTQATHSDGNPYISISDGTPATTEVVFIVKVAPMEWSLAKDVLGLSAQVYVPTVIQIATETNADAGSVARVTKSTHILALLGPIVTKGCVVEWYEQAAGNYPTIASITGTPTATFKDLYWSFKKAQ
jgi:hypothetical protein